MNVEATFQEALRAAQSRDFAAAELKLRTILDHDPHEVNALRMLGSLKLAHNELQEAQTLLSLAVELAPKFVAAVVDLAKCYHQQSQNRQAATLLSDLVAMPQADYLCLQLYADILFALDQGAQARQAQQKSIERDPHNNDIGQAIEHLQRGRGREAEQVYRRILSANPVNVHALVGLASIALDKDVTADAERLLDHARAQSPNYSHVERAFARLYMKQGLYQEAEDAAIRATNLSPEAAECWTSLGTVYAWGLKQDLAAQAFDKSLEINQAQPRVHLSQGHVQKALGDAPASISAYRAALQSDPLLGEAWWSLADLKTFEFSSADLTEMQQLVQAHDFAQRPRDLASLHFALGKALEDRSEAASAFDHYAQGNQLRAQHEQFHTGRFHNQIAAAKQVFRPSAGGNRYERSIPIFVVGLPRSGSTLVDQILTSHSQVQGTMELAHILGYVRELGHDQDAPRDKNESAYPESVLRMSEQELLDLGKRYLDETATYHQNAPFFVDKMPNNFLHIGLIARMLPSARFVDTRRHPMGCCFSIFKQNFARGQAFGYSLETLGAYYRGYLELMAHWRAIMPERIHTVIYEHLVDDTEAQVRLLLQHCGLDFEAQCLSFYQNDRVVRTASAEQVRQPIYTTGKDQWRHFEKNLNPLEESLGSALVEWTQT